MQVLVIGGTRFIGVHVVAELIAHGHTPVLFNRGQSQPPPGVPPLPPGIRRITGDRRQLDADTAAALRAVAPDAVVDMGVVTAADAESMLAALAGATPRYVLISSCDVYRAYGVLIGLEEGLEPVPLTEDSPLRGRRYPYRSSEPRAADDPQRIMDDYDKIPAEEAALSQPQVAGTVLRLPMVYGPGDYQHRLGAHAGQLKQGAALEVSAALADWRTCRGYVADIARGIVLAAEAEQAAGRVYNIGEADGFSEREWAEAVAQAVGSTTGVQVVENADGTGGMNAAQHLTINTTRIRSELGYAEALPLAERITRTIAWEQEQLAE